jgi:hypothetical protein
MAATPVLLRVIPPQIDLSENIQPKALIAQSPQQVRCIQYPSTSFSQSNAVFNTIYRSRPRNGTVQKQSYIQANF